MSGMHETHIVRRLPLLAIIQSKLKVRLALWHATLCSHTGPDSESPVLGYQPRTCTAATTPKFLITFKQGP